MAIVKFTYALKRFYPNLDSLNLEGKTAIEIVSQLNAHFPGMQDYLLDNQGALREHVNIFIDGKPISDRIQLQDVVEADTEVYVMQALSGG